MFDPITLALAKKYTDEASKTSEIPIIDLEAHGIDLVGMMGSGVTETYIDGTAALDEFYGYINNGQMPILSVASMGAAIPWSMYNLPILPRTMSFRLAAYSGDVFMDAAVFITESGSGRTWIRLLIITHA